MCKKVKRLLAVFCVLVFLSSVVVFTGIAVVKKQLPSSFQVVQGGSLNAIGNLPVKSTVVQTGNVKSVQNAMQKNAQYTVRLNLLGVFPITDASVTVVDAQNVQLCGESFGIKLYTQGVLVVGISNVETQEGVCNPAEQAGLKIGDMLISINGTSVSSNTQVANIVANSNGSPLTMVVQRGQDAFSVTLNPVLSKSDQKYRAGIWVRDSSAGIGTLTFYDPTTNVVAGLGHGVCDVDTGELLPIASGQMVQARILNVQKGQKGTPGELLGCFSSGKIANLLQNHLTGVYGIAENYPLSGQLIPVAMKQEVKSGQAQIVTTVGQEKSLFDCVIEKVHFNDSGLTQNMTIHITDERLLQQTGGIVQGMSGSPILQNGKLVGAITHVLVDDPTKGYAIFAENMLKTAQSVSNTNLKQAS